MEERIGEGASARAGAARQGVGGLFGGGIGWVAEGGGPVEGERRAVLTEENGSGEGLLVEESVVQLLLPRRSDPRPPVARVRRRVRQPLRRRFLLHRFRREAGA